MPAKALFQELVVGPTLTPGDHSSSTCAPQEAHTQFQVVSEPPALQVRCPRPRVRMLNLLVCNPMNFSLNPKPLPTLCSPYKKGHFKMEFRWSVRVRTRLVLISPAMCIKRHKDSVPVAADWVW